jgi:predicted  nucleic acid-binding Zn-ribbon protein
MGRKCLYVLAAILVLVSLQSCSSKPEQSLLRSYFHAIQMKDLATMASMAIEPVEIEAQSWKIIKTSPVTVEPAALPELNKKEAELKKKLEDHVGVTLDAKDALDAATDTWKATRTGAAKKRMDDLQAEYDKIRGEHNDLQKEYNDAKAAAAREEEITKFSLGAGEVSNIRDLTGDVRSMTVDVQVTLKDGQTKNYEFDLRQYDLKDEAANLARKGRWIIVKITALS